MSEFAWYIYEDDRSDFNEFRNIAFFLKRIFMQIDVDAVIIRRELLCHIFQFINKK